MYGKIIGGRYRLLQKIGTGGMASVWLAEDIRNKKRWAIKEAGKREYRLLELPRHKGIPMVIDCIEEEDGIYMVMEYVEGITMQEYLDREGSVEQGQALCWMKELIEILYYLHNLRPSVYYLDMKPSNIIIGKEGNLILIDLGAAMEADEVMQERAGCFGTYGYAPLELTEGIERCDERSDIYSLGMTFYYMLTGNNPGEPPFGCRGTEEMEKKQKEFFEKCLQEKKELRYQNMEEMKEAVEKMRGGKQRRKFILVREKSVFRSGKKRVGLFLLLAGFIVGTILGMGKAMVHAQMETFLLVIRNDRGEKILMQEEAVYPVQKNLLLEVPGEYFHEGFQYEVSVEITECESGRKRRQRVVAVLDT